MHALKKLRGTIRICFILFMARTFGRYEHSGFNGEFEYRRYRWRGDSWCIPTKPYEEYEL